MKNRIAIILARGGSKRIPRKNLVDFCGTPLVVWSILAAIDSGVFNKVLVSTDDQEIANLSIEAGADVPFLRTEATDDFSPSSHATLASLAQAEAFWGEEFDSVSQLMANCPLRDKLVVRDFVRAFENSKAPSQLSCFRYGWMNPWWAASLGKDNLPEYIFSTKRESRSQDLPKLYCPSGAIWIAKSHELKIKGSFYMEGHRLEPLRWDQALDIDDEGDLMMARAVATSQRVN